jgi:hypothetical protein
MCAALFVGFSYDRRFFVLVLILLSSSTSSSSSSLRSRGGELLTSVQLTDQVETFSGMCGVMSAPVWMLGRSG